MTAISYVNEVLIPTGQEQAAVAFYVDGTSLINVCFNKATREWLGNISHVDFELVGRKVYIIASSPNNTATRTSKIVGPRKSPTWPFAVGKAADKLDITCERKAPQMEVAIQPVIYKEKKAFVFELPHMISLKKEIIDSLHVDKIIDTNTAVANDNDQLTALSKRLLEGHDAKYAISLIRQLMKDAKALSISNYKLREDGQLMAEVSTLI